MFLDVLRAFEKLKVRYLICGGVAVVLHGYPRSTADLDLLLDMKAANIKLFLALMKKLGYKPRLPLPADDLLDSAKRNDWIQNRNLAAFTFVHVKNKLCEIDVVLNTTLSFDLAWKNRVELPVEGIKARVLCLDDLIRMKEEVLKKTGRLKDSEDASALRKIRRQKKGDGDAC